MDDTNHMDCPFCRIIAGITRAHIYLRDDALLVMAAPDAPDDVLVVPLDHVTGLLEMPTELTTRLIDAAVQASAVLRVVREVDAQSIQMATKNEHGREHFHIRIASHDSPDEHLSWLASQPNLNTGALIDPLIRSMQGHIE